MKEFLLCAAIAAVGLIETCIVDNNRLHYIQDYGYDKVLSTSSLKLCAINNDGDTLHSLYCLPIADDEMKNLLGTTPNERVSLHFFHFVID